MRFGDWRRGEPSVLLDCRKWIAYGKPEYITITLGENDGQDH